MNFSTLMRPAHGKSELALLDVLRGLMALIVFGAHITQILLWRLAGDHSPLAIFAGVAARHAVLVFFLLSGHLITGSVISNIKKNGRFQIGDYATARIARIYPPLLGAIALCIAAWTIIHILHLPGSYRYGIAGDLYRVRDQFDLSGHDIFGTLTMQGGLSDADGPLWTLFIEVQIYIVAMGIASLWQNQILEKTACVLLGIAALYLLRDNLFFVLIWTLGASTCAIHLTRQEGKIVALAVAVTAMATAAFHPNWLSALMDEPPGRVLQFASCLLYALVMFYIRPNFRYPAPIAATANFSYSLYVMHWPMLMLCLSLTQNWVGHDLFRGIIISGIAAVCILTIVIPSAAILERHRQIKAALQKSRLSGRPWNILWSAAAITAILSVVSVRGYRHYQSCQPHFDEAYVYIPADGGTPRARVILIPGMDGSAKNFLSTPLFQSWANGLARLGADVVVLNTPIPKPCWFTDGGQLYHERFLGALANIKADVTKKHGAQNRILISGVSYGGLHVLEAFAADPKAYIGWQASVSVTKLAALAELKGVGELRYFDPFNQVAVLKGSNGYITWGGRDMRVDHHLTERFYNEIASPRTVGKGYPWLGHETDALTVANLLADAKQKLDAYRRGSP